MTERQSKKWQLDGVKNDRETDLNITENKVKSDRNTEFKMTGTQS